MRSQVVALVGAALGLISVATAAPAVQYGSSSPSDFCEMVTVYVMVPSTSTVEVIHPTTTQVTYSTIVHTSTAPGSTEIETVYVVGSSTQNYELSTVTSSEVTDVLSSDHITTTLYSMITLTKARSTTTKTETIEVTSKYPSHTDSQSGNIYLTYHHTTIVEIATVDSTAPLSSSTPIHTPVVVTVYETVTGPQPEPTYIIETITVIPLPTAPPYVHPTTSKDVTTTLTIRSTVSSTLLPNYYHAPSSSPQVYYVSTTTDISYTSTGSPYHPQYVAVSVSSISGLSSSEYSTPTGSISSSGFSTVTSSAPAVDTTCSESSLEAHSSFTPPQYGYLSSISSILPTEPVNLSNSYIPPIRTSTLNAHSGFTAAESSIMTSIASKVVSPSKGGLGPVIYDVIYSAGVSGGTYSSVFTSMLPPYPMASSSSGASGESSSTHRSPPHYATVSSSGARSGETSSIYRSPPPYPMVFTTGVSSKASPSSHRSLLPYPILMSTGASVGASSSVFSSTPSSSPLVSSTANTSAISSSSYSGTLPPSNSAPVYIQSPPPYVAILSSSPNATTSPTSYGSSLNRYNMTSSTVTSGGVSAPVYTFSPPPYIIISSSGVSAGLSSTSSDSSSNSYEMTLSTRSSASPLTSSAFTVGRFTFTFPYIISPQGSTLVTSTALSSDTISIASYTTSTAVLATSPLVVYGSPSSSLSVTSFGAYTFVIPSSVSVVSGVSETTSSPESVFTSSTSYFQSDQPASSSATSSLSSSEELPSTSFSLVPHLTSTLTDSSTTFVVESSPTSVIFSSYTFNSATGSSVVNSNDATSSSTTPDSVSSSTSALSSSSTFNSAADSSAVTSATPTAIVSSSESLSPTSMDSSNTSGGTASSPAAATESILQTSSENVSPTATMSVSINFSTSVSPTSSPSATSCGPSGDFTLNFDDIPPLSAPDNTTNPEPIFSPYHKFWFAGGLVVVPPPTVPYLPSSGNLFLELLKNFTTIDTGFEIGSTAEIGTGPDAELECFGFNVIGASIGCNSTGPTCDWQFTGLRYNAVTSASAEITTQFISTPSCPSLSNCVLVSVTLDSTFQDLTSVRINVTVAGLPQIWWLDDLELGWTDNSCDASTCRQIHH